MARIIVTPDEHSDVVLLDENVYPVHLDNEISSRQVAERLAWAVSDAEATERAGPFGAGPPRTGCTFTARRNARPRGRPRVASRAGTGAVQRDSPARRLTRRTPCL